MARKHLHCPRCNGPVEALHEVNLAFAVVKTRDGLRRGPMVNNLGEIKRQAAFDWPEGPFYDEAEEILICRNCDYSTTPAEWAQTFVT